jgi:exosortase
LIVAAVVAVALAYAPMLTVFFRQQWSRPQSQFFPFVILAFGVLFWTRWKEGGEPVKRDSRWSRIVSNCLICLAWMALFFAAALYNPWLSATSLNVLLAGVGVALSRRRSITYLWGLWAMLWVMVPLPLGLDQRLISFLQLFSSKLSSYLLDALGVLHIMEGNTLHLPDRQLFVDEACSGIVSVMSIVACSLIYGVWRNRTPFHILTLSLAGIAWAVLMNVFRITIIAVLLAWCGIDWTSGTPHELLSLGIFLVIFGGLLSTDLLIESLLEPVVENWHTQFASEIPFGHRLATWWDWLTSWGDPLQPVEAAAPGNGTRETGSPSGGRPGFMLPLTTAFGLLAACQIGFLAWAFAHPAKPSQAVQLAEELSEASLPAEVAGLHRVNFEAEQRERSDIFGEFSRSYYFEDDQGRTYLLSFDFPFSQGWHELTVCYAGAGWQIDKRESLPVAFSASDSEASRPDWTIVAADLSRPGGRYAKVQWTLFDEFGEPVSPPAGEIRDQVWRLLVRRSPLAPTRQMFQVQVYCEGDAPLDEKRTEAAKKLLLEAREKLVSQVAPPEGS